MGNVLSQGIHEERLNLYHTGASIIQMADTFELTERGVRAWLWRSQLKTPILLHYRKRGSFTKKKRKYLDRLSFADKQRVVKCVYDLGRCADKVGGKITGKGVWNFMKEWREGS